MKLKKSVIVIFISIIVGLLAISASVYFYTRYQKALKQLQNPQAASQEEVNDTVKRISKLIDLPQGEQPTLATVTDITKLSDQPFFAKAKNGDKVLIYNTARKAYLYDPQMNKILEVAPLSVASGSATSEAANNYQIAIYNGTNVIGLSSAIEQELQKAQQSVNVVLRDNAKKKDYAKTLVIDLTGSQKEKAQQLANTIKGQVSTLPEGETRPTLPTGSVAEFLIIVGNDHAPTSAPTQAVVTTPAQ